MVSNSTLVKEAIDRAVAQLRAGQLSYPDFVRSMASLLHNVTVPSVIHNPMNTELLESLENNSTSTCTGKFGLDEGYYTFAAIGLLCVLFMSFLTERIDKPGVLHWLCRIIGFNVGDRRFGLCVPVCFWQRSGNRIVHAVSFGATMFTAWTLISGKSLISWKASNTTMQSFVNIFVKIILMFIFGFMYYPMFAGAAIGCQPLGYFIGLAITLGIEVFYSTYSSHCSNQDLLEEGTASSPHLGVVFFCLSLITYYFVVMLLRMLLRRNLPPDSEEAKLCFRAPKYPAHDHVKRLLVPGAVWSEQKRIKALNLAKANIVKRILWKFWYVDDVFRFSTGYLSALVLGVVGVIIIFTYIMYSMSSALDSLEDAFSSIKKIREFFRILRPFLIVAYSLAFTIILLGILVAMGTYRRDIQRLYRGDRRRLPKLGTPLSQGQAYVKFVGYQGAFLAAGFAWLVIVLGFACFLASLIVWYAIHIDYTVITRLAALIAPPLVSTITVIILLSIIVNKCFLPEEEEEEEEEEAENKGEKQGSSGDDVSDNEEMERDKEDRLLADKRQVATAFVHTRGLQFFSYVMVFYFMMLGIVSAIVRIIISLLINLLHVGRLDSPVLPPMWLILDSGYKIYGDYLQVEVAHSHPVLISFLDIVCSLVKKKIGTALSHEELSFNDVVESQPGSGDTETFNRAKRKWLLAYTLMRNPNLSSLRKHVLDSKKSRGMNVNSSQSLQKMTRAKTDPTVNSSGECGSGDAVVNSGAECRHVHPALDNKECGGWACKPTTYNGNTSWEAALPRAERDMSEEQHNQVMELSGVSAEADVVINTSSSVNERQHTSSTWPGSEMITTTVI